MYCIQYNHMCITLTARVSKNNLHFNCAYTLTTFQKQVSINKWQSLMLIWIRPQLLSMLMLMSLSSIATFYFSFLEVVLTLTASIVNLVLISTRAYISQCRGKQLLNSQSLMLMSNQGLVLLSLMLTLMSIKSKVNFQF